MNKDNSARIAITDVDKRYKHKPNCKTCSGKGWHTQIILGKVQGDWSKTDRRLNRLCQCARPIEVFT